MKSNCCAQLLLIVLGSLAGSAWAQTPPTVSMTLRVKVPANTPANDKIWIWSGMVFAVTTVHTPFTLVSGTTDTWQATVSAPQGTIFRYFYNRNDTFGTREKYAAYDSSPSSLLSPFHFRELVVTSGATVNEVISMWTDTALLDYSTGTVTGRVTDEQGRPLTGIWVTAGPRRRETNPEGVYVIPGVPAGQGVITFQAENGEYRATTVAADFPADGTLTRDVTLTTAVMSTLTFNVTVPSDTPTDAKVRIYGDTFRLGMADTQYDNFVESTQMIDMTPAGVNRWTYTVQVGSGTCLNYIYTLGHYLKNNERAGGGAIVTRPICFSGDATFNDTVAAWKTPQQVPVTLNLQSPTSEVEFYVTTSDVSGGFSLLRMWSTGPDTAKFIIYANPNTTLSYRYERGDRDPDVTLGDLATLPYRTIAVGSSGAASTDTVQWRGQMMEPALTTVTTGITRPVSVRSPATPFQAGIFPYDAWLRPMAPLVATTASRMKSKNAQWIRAYSIRSLSDGKDGPRLDRGGVSIPDQDLVRYVRQAKAEGLRVDLRSDIVPNSFTGTHTNAWIDQFFGEFQSYLLHDAKIAQEEGVEIFEVKTTGWPNETSATKAYINAKYKALIAAVRASGYTGKLESEKVNVQPEFDWYADLDYLAGPFSFPAGITATDSVQTLYDAAVSRLNSTFLPLVTRFHKPFILTGSFDSTTQSALQSINKDTQIGHLVPNNPAILSSFDAQARAYQALGLAAAGMPWIQGLFPFYAYWDEDSKSVSIRSKTAEEIVSQIYQQVQANTLSANCSYSLNSGGQMIPAAGGSASVTVTASAECGWKADGMPSWVTANGSGTGNGSVSFTVAANAGAARTAIFTIAGIIFNIEQASGQVSGLAAAGSFAHVASQGTWKYTLAMVNLGGGTATGRFTFAGDAGNSLALPLTSDQPTIPLMSGPVMATTLERTLAPNAQYVTESTGPNGAAVLIGSGQMFGSGNIGAFGIFSNPTQHWDAVVPIETRNASKYVLAFDNTGVLLTGVAVSNVASSAAAIGVIIRDDTGAQIFSGTINLPAQGHRSFLLNDPQFGYPVTNGKRGTIEFQPPAGGQISVLGLRANGLALTTLPVLASSDAAGGSIAHATYNGGFTSVFYIVNTGTSSADFTLSFFNEAGGALTVPLLLPQSGTNTTTAALTRTLAAGAMLVVQTVGNDSLASVLGSAQLTSTGSVSGFEIFRWNPYGQEASVPLETRTPSSFVLVFDDTGGLTTGVALANQSASGANVTVKIYDDAGTLLQTSSISLVGRGHTSFLLPDADRYPVTTNKRGMVEFVVPSGGKISAIGLRAKADGTLTTIPVLTK